MIERDKLGRYARFETTHLKAFYPPEAYDGNGNLLHYITKDPLGEENHRFCYDDLDQLILENSHTYLFDSHYNRIKKDDLPYAIDPLCQVTSDGKTVYAYDLCGNLTYDGKRKYTYDSLDRLIAVENGAERVEYTYDPFNRRLAKTLFVDGKKIEQTRFLWDGDNEIGSIDEKNQIQQLRIMGEGLEAEMGASVLCEINQRTYLPLHDHRGCLSLLIDLQTKQPVECYRYTAYGEELTENRLSPWRFASKRVDEESGLVFFGRRYYHPALGRWITQDPAGLTDGPNLYAYLHNCPLADFDPYGLWSWRGMWNGSKEFVNGGWDYSKSIFKGIGYGSAQMGQWMYADFQYEYFNDRSCFTEKSYRSVEGWKNLGHAVRSDPLDAFVPGVMEAWRNPTSPAAWGKATVDVALSALTLAKLGSSVARLGTAGRAAEGASTFNRSRGMVTKLFATEQTLPNKVLKLENSIVDSLGISYEKVSEKITTINNSQLLNTLNNSSKGCWVKVYEAGLRNGKEVEIHYFRNNATGHVFDVKVKYDYWHQKDFKKIKQ